MRPESKVTALFLGICVIVWNRVNGHRITHGLHPRTTVYDNHRVDIDKAFSRSVTPRSKLIALLCGLHERVQQSLDNGHRMTSLAKRWRLKYVSFSLP